jgi:hypothetical protein
MSRHVHNLGRRGGLLATLLVAVLCTSMAAWAFWSTAGKGSAGGQVASLSVPTITKAGGGAESAALEWSAVSAPGSGSVKYYVSRNGESVGGTCPAASSPTTVTSCTDANVPAGGHSYTVTAVWRSWTATSASKAVTVISNPTVSSANPSSRGQGASGQAITITGSHFQSGASASFSGAGITVNSTTFKSSTEVTANVSVLAGASTGSRNITVTNLDGGAGTGSGVFAINAGPTVTSTSPSSRGQGASKQTVVIKGSGFTAGASANFGSGVTVESTTFKSSTELTAKVTVEAGAAIGSRSVSVTNTDAGAGSATAFTVNAAPTIESASPSSRVQGSSQTVTIKGKNFSSGSELAASFSGTGVTVSSTTFKSSTELTASVTVSSSAAVGARSLSVTNADSGTGSLANAFTVDSPPNVESVTPNAGDKGGTQAVSIRGTGFASNASVSFGSGIEVESTTFVSSTELTAEISVQTFASSGSRTVTVTNSDGGTDSLANAFTVFSAPSIESVSPSSRAEGASNQTITVKGKNFLNGAGLGVSFSGSGITVNSTSFVSSTEVTANVTIASNAPTGSRTLTVKNPDTTSASSTFTVNAGPTVSSVNPTSRGQGASKATVTIKGSGFASGAAASFGAGVTVESTVRNSSSELVATISVEAAAATGPRTVTVTNADGGTASLANGFAVNAAPNLESINPSSRGQGTSGQTITVKGSGFVSGATVTFSGSGVTATTSFKSSSELVATVAVTTSATVGPRTVTVTNPDEGADTLVNAFTVNAAPNVESVSPNAGDRGGTQAVAIKGSGFGAGATVTVAGGGVNVSSVNVKSATEITANLAIESTASTGSRTVTVTNTDGGTDQQASAFTVNSAPSIESVSPSSRAQGSSNQTIAIKGKNFLSGASVSISGTELAVNSTTFVSSTEVTASITIAAGATTGSRNVTVTNPDTTSATLNGGLAIDAPPTVTSTSPSSRAQGAPSATVAIKGSGFISGSGLALAFSGSGVNVESISFVSSTELSAKVAVESGAATGSRNVTVTNGDGGVGSLASGFTVNAKPTISSPTSSSNKVEVEHGKSQEFKVIGTGFASGATVSVSGGFTVNSTTVASSTELKVKVTAGSSFTERNTYGLTVTNQDGGTATSAGSIKNF